ncbi:hypothetical protein Y032_0688g1543 [Ancylostoma ceylanicum]|uniref:Proteasome subunit alpha type n=1 Tax=Ancylostoma ceylanicum TaxID=53326 RepID=A0A016WGC8_9BILA|nr:hypothetical protein Y032_0688g1543 [Ancylostoma ceylanicum]
MFLTRSEYDRGVNTFSPEGRLFQVEYAIEAVKLGSTSIGIRTNEGVLLAAEKRSTSKLMVNDAIEKISKVDEHVGHQIMGETPLASTANSITDDKVPVGLDAATYREYYEKCSARGKTILDNECQMLYECRSCGEIFRSLMFFISHKRTFCRETPGIEIGDSRKLSNRDALTGAKPGRPPKKRGPKSKNSDVAKAVKSSKGCKKQKETLGAAAAEVSNQENIVAVSNADTKG